MRDSEQKSAQSLGGGVSGDAVSVQPWLRALVRFAGFVCCLAWLAVAMPIESMHWWHASLGLGHMPQGAIVEYLARSTAALCALYGMILLWISCDLARHVQLIRLITLTVSGLTVGCCLVMWKSGLPHWWLVGDAAANLSLFVGVLWGTRNAG